MRACVCVCACACACVCVRACLCVCVFVGGCHRSLYFSFSKDFSRIIALNFFALQYRTPEPSFGEHDIILDNLKVAWVEISTLSCAVLIDINVTAYIHAYSHF